ncbi:MAG: methyltransferase domain-containing protein [Xenococcaceae cyanobacterium MO_188.B29]|nr:methyltransferase domain-containing protein [Xenococcaceae cyanobacterium MO_188.B29]
MIDISQLLIDKKYICTEAQIQELKKLLSSYPNNSPSLEQMWQMMDDVWDALGCDNKNLNWEKISAFYNHPVWILNGLFIEQHDLSMQHRQSISNWINLNSEQIKYVVDYGGGMGTLAKLIAESNPSLSIDIYEPYPSQVAIKSLTSYSNIQFVDKLKNFQYDCLISTDVLEHVADPLGIFAQMISSVKLGRSLIIANCFAPVIKCHLPSTFHLRYTFKIFAKLMGLKLIGACQETHATVYLKEKEKSLNWRLIRQVETLSKSIYPILKSLHEGYRGLKKLAT